ncbi:AMP-binding protein [Citricoccus alkalitolerans]|uniref:AMP-binding protein n=1 Tax=Citricoccus alkalitolerans TaxID=246603 RepID=A0ABV8XT87_9MICC
MSDLNVPLTPLRFLGRAAEVHPGKRAVIDGDRTWTYAQFADHTQQMARALRASGVRAGDAVAFLGANSAELLTAHYAVPLLGAALVAVNSRLSPEEVSYICKHSSAVLVLGDGHLLEQLSGTDLAGVRERIEIPAQDGSSRQAGGTVPFTDFLARAAGDDTQYQWEVDDEDRVIAINYTSGTTGRPKGVMYSHRGAYLNALGEVYHQGFAADSRYLWTLPMFHCNGWCTTWAVTAASALHVCLRAVRGETMWKILDEEEITHMCGAPTVLTTLASAPQAHRLEHPLTIVTAGAPPTPTVISRIRELGAHLLHVYGLTETYGPYAVCEPQPSWATDLDSEQQASLLARQGVGMLTSERLRVVRGEPSPDGTLIDVSPNGSEMGELVMRGNSVMKGYLGDPDGTADAFRGGWFHSGDLGVMHPDGYVQILDRAKDVIISGGENISTIEVEQALASHPAVFGVAVVGTPDPKWGERPMAFIVTDGTEISEAELLAHVRSKIASYKVPDRIEFRTQLPTTSTGKIRKSVLRDNAGDRVGP